MIHSSYSDFPSFIYTHLCVGGVEWGTITLLSPIQFCHLCRLVYPPPQSRNWTVSTPQGSLLLPFYNHSHFPATTTLAPPWPLANTNLTSVSKISSFQKCYIKGTMCYVTIWDWLFSLKKIWSTLNLHIILAKGPC